HCGGDQIRGSEVCLIQAIEALSDRGFNIVLIRKNNCLDEVVAEHVSDILDESFPEIMFDGPHKSFPIFKYMHSVYRLFQLVKHYKPSVIYCNTGLPCQLAVPVGKLLNTPILCHFHHPVPKRYLYIWLVKFANKLVFPSEYTRSVVADKCGRDGDVIYNAIDTNKRFIPVARRDNSYRQMLGIEESTIVVGQVGNLTKHKRPDVLIRCFANARDRVSNLHLVLVGDGSMHAELQNLIGKLGLKRVVTLAGYVPDVLPYYQHVFDINVLASSVEGLGISVIEASACALPSIVTDCTGLREVVDDNTTGLTFDRDKTAQLTAGIVRLANDPDLRSKLALAAREKAEKYFSLERYKVRIVRQIENLC
ncbi:MAG: glycosyltransferase family 4 protein, partial [Gammaproteobacteria bacterium]